MDQTGPYVVIEGAYMVRQDAPISAAAYGSSVTAPWLAGPTRRRYLASTPRV